MLPLHSRFLYTITSWHGNVFRVTDPLQAHGWIPQGHKEPVKRSFGIFFVGLNKILSEQTAELSVIWRYCNMDKLIWRCDISPCLTLCCLTDMWSTFCCRMSVSSIAKRNTRFYQTLLSQQENLFNFHEFWCTCMCEMSVSGHSL